VTLTADFVGIDYLVVQRALGEWVLAGSGLPVGQVYWDGQNGKRQPGPAISMRLMSTDVYGRDWLDHDVNHISFGPLTITAVDTATGRLTITNHGLSTGDGTIQFDSTGAPPAPLVVGKNYYVVVDDANTVRIAAKFTDAMNGQPSAPAPIVIAPFGDSGTGTTTLSSTPDTMRAGREIIFKARGQRICYLTLQCHAKDGVGMEMALSILSAIQARRPLPSQRDILYAAKIAIQDIGQVRPVRMGGQVINAATFEPRAVLDIKLGLASTVTEYGTIIERADITNEVLGITCRVPQE